MIKKVMISTVYSGTALGYAAHKLGVDKVYLVVTAPPAPESAQAEKEFRERYKGLIEVVRVTIPQYDIASGAEQIVRIIRKEAEHEVYVHTSEGRKTMMLSLLFAAYVEKRKVKPAYYVGSEDHKAKLIQLPLLEFRVRGNKKKILQELKAGEDDAVKIGKKLGIHKSMVYSHLKALIRDGYLDEDWKLTDAGRVVVL